MAEGRLRACMGVGDVNWSSCRLRRAGAGTKSSFQADISTYHTSEEVSNSVDDLG